MLFDEILDILRDNGKSGLAYQMTVERADAAMRQDPERAAGYRLLCAFAERFLESTGRLPITTARTEEAFQEFAQVAATLKSAYDSGDLEARLSALNDISVQSREPLDLTPAARE